MVLGTKPTFAVLSLVSVMAFVLSLDVIATATMASTFILHGRFNQIAENAYIRSCSSIFITYLLFQMISQRVFIERQPSQIISFLCTFGTVFYVGKLATQNLRESSSTK